MLVVRNNRYRHLPFHSKFACLKICIVPKAINVHRAVKAVVVVVVCVCVCGGGGGGDGEIQGVASER